MKKEEREIEKIIADDRHMRFGVCHLVSSPGNAFVCHLIICYIGELKAVNYHTLARTRKVIRRQQQRTRVFRFTQSHATREFFRLF